MTINLNKPSPKRILCIVGKMDAGGAETFLMKIYRNLDRVKYQMDFCVAAAEEGFYDQEIQLMGGKIFRSVPKTRNLLKSFGAIKRITQKNQYKIVMRVSQHSLSALDLIAAKLGGAETLIFRSSNASIGGGVAYRLLHYFFKWLPIVVPTVKIAPSIEAAEFLFGKNCITKKKAVLIKNGISVDDYIFNPQRRDDVRRQLNINNEFVIGHIGRFSKQKNHYFLIDVFYEIVRRHENSVLLLVGKGELERDIKRKIADLGLVDKVIFTGIRKDIPDILMAMDVFIFPSFYEGMPNVVIEAQATGLPCIVSDTITREANITGLVEYLPLKESLESWAERALKYNCHYERKNMKEIMVSAGYDIGSVLEDFIALIFGGK